MKKNIQKYKIYFTVILFVSLVIAVYIGPFTKTTPYFEYSQLTHGLKTLTYKVDFAGGIVPYINNKVSNNKIEYKNTNAPSIPVLVYHGIPNQSDHSLTNITSETFKNHLFALKNAGYNTITTEELFSYLQGKTKLPEKSIMITFDDGRNDSYKIADPILDALNYKAVMFAIGRYPLLNERSSYYLTRNQLIEMSNNGRWDVEAHSYDGHNSYFTSPTEQNGHFFSHKIWLFGENRLETDQEFQTRIDQDLLKAKQDIGEALKKTIDSFAFPYGDYGQNSTNFSLAKNIVVQDTAKLYSLAFYQNVPGKYYSSNYFLPEYKDNPFFLVTRINTNPEWSGQDLVETLRKGEAKPLPYDDNFSKDNGWVRIWGELTHSSSTMSLQAGKYETGASVILDGSRLWSNYTLTATVNSPRQQGIYVWARLQDERDSASCNFGNSFINIEQTVNGVQRIIKGNDFKQTIIPTKDFSIKVEVKDRNITCTLNNTYSVTSAFLDEKLSTGGIGFKTWEKNPGESSLVIKNLHVTEI